MLMEFLGLLLDKFILLILGGTSLFVSIKKKEKLGNKAALLRAGGIFLLVWGITSLTMVLLK